MRRAWEVVASGPLATVQDLGRPGLADLGVGPSGAADRAACRLANRLVGNARSAAVVETTLGGLVLVARGDLWVAVTGAPCPIQVQGRHEAVNTLLRVPDGAEFRVDAPVSGLRGYVAVRGGIAVEPVLGSRSTDLLSGLGPAALAPGAVLPVGDETEEFPAVEVAPVPPPADGDVVLEVVPGPRDAWFTTEALRTLVHESYEVTADSNRIGIRLSGPGLCRSEPGELPSEGMVPGAVQVPPSGRPTVFLADHPLTGGYPVVGVVRDHDVDRVAQLRPGQQVRFRWPRRPAPG
ncbi:5-oxoprolinase/urea amidolyase family protein [Allosaccharopolyspora coralli]|uniref:5-oxoprolinase/urea amidolyase family protein n=1 Tax=Allosaccharopolyspora coralli TaxID=2665642 RepID=A0A5Q3Q923_9PSEU|nr:biotin-dependent carboxyltransferase family protein [Allosaccharopolyspora coralli]QGK69926.1 5-oxoprolinase/urea amidolyase family protein [Allosaccharopolyspora coralli]